MLISDPSKPLGAARLLGRWHWHTPTSSSTTVPTATIGLSGTAHIRWSYSEGETIMLSSRVSSTARHRRHASRWQGHRTRFRNLYIVVGKTVLNQHLHKTKAAKIAARDCRAVSSVAPYLLLLKLAAARSIIQAAAQQTF